MTKKYRLEDLDCANCAAKMEEAIRGIGGVRSASVAFMAQSLTVEAEDGDFAAVMKQAVKLCRKIEPDCTIVGA